MCETLASKNMKRLRRKGHDRPCHPPSIFKVPASYCQQTLSSPREVKKRKIDAESRLEGQLKFDEQNDVIGNWGDMVGYCRELEGLVVAKGDGDYIQLHEIKGMSPVLFFSIIIYEDFNLVCYQEDRKITARGIVAGFSAKLERYLQLDNIILRMRKHCPNIHDVMKSYCCKLQELLSTVEIDDDDMHRVQFLVEQMNIQNAKPCGNRYGNSPSILRTSLNLYMRSRNCYNE